MKTESDRMKGVAMIAMAAVIFSAFVPMCLLSEEADADEAEPDYSFHRYSIKFFSTSTNAKYLAWDFADGTILDGRWEYYVQQQENGAELSEDIIEGIEAYKQLLIENGNSIYCPIHTYTEKGVYDYTITAFNPIGYVGPSGTVYDGDFFTDDEGYDGGLFSGSDDVSLSGSKDVAYIILEVLGYPVITLVDGDSVSSFEVVNNEEFTKAVRPEDPVRDGYGFLGWFTDENCTDIYDWEQIVTDDLTLYAGWENISVPEPGPVNITINVNGTPVTLGYGKIVADLPVEEKEGMTFAGWFSDEALTQAVGSETAVVDGMSLFAKYDPAQIEDVDPEVEDDDKDYIVPAAVLVAGLLVIFVGIRFHPVFAMIGIVIAAVGALDLAGIVEVL